VIGVNAQIRSDSGGNDGIGFAIPSSTVRSIVSQLVATGKAEHAFLGIALQDAPSQRGAAVTEVRPGTPAADAGLRVGDVITKVEDREIASADKLSAAINARSPGDTISITYMRDGESHTVEVKLTNRPS
jgi:putative serine protease PepD